MAIKRLDPNARYDVVCVFDDALQNETQEELTAINNDPTKSRYNKYLESFDLNDLKFKEGSKPTIFQVRCLKGREQAELQQKFYKLNPETRKVEITNQVEMLYHIYDTCCLGIKLENGSVEKVLSDELEPQVVSEVASMVSILSTLGKNQKK